MGNPGDPEQLTNGGRESILNSEGYDSINRGVDNLAFHFIILPNQGGNIRAGASLEPFNEVSVKKVQRLLRSGLEETVGSEGLEFTGTNVEKVEEPLSEIIRKYKKGENDFYFLTRHLKEHYSKFKGGILIIQADVNNFVEPHDVYLLGMNIVENEPFPLLQDFCRENNLKLLFLFNQWDYNKYIN